MELWRRDGGRKRGINYTTTYLKKKILNSSPRIRRCWLLSINEIARHSRLFFLALSFFLSLIFALGLLTDLTTNPYVSCVLYLICLFVLSIYCPALGIYFITAGPALAGAFRGCDQCRCLPTLTEKEARKEGWRPPSFLKEGGVIKMSRICDAL